MINPLTWWCDQSRGGAIGPLKWYDQSRGGAIGQCLKLRFKIVLPPGAEGGKCVHPKDKH